MADSLCAAQRARRAANQKAAHSCLWPGRLQPIIPSPVAICDIPFLSAVIPPVTALLGSKTDEETILAFPELGMEALHLIKVDRYPAIIAAAHGRSIYEK